MIIIGEKINGSIPSTGKAIAEKDEAYIRELARKQTEFGADYIDVCAGTPPEIEVETLNWLVDLVQDEVDTPICIDSSSPDTILTMLPKLKVDGMVNSVSMEAGKCEKIMPAIKDGDWKLIALTCDSAGIPEAPETKIRIADELMAEADKYGIAHNRMFIDPLVMTLGTITTALVSFNKAVSVIKEKYPDVHITSGLSNISFGLPLRRALNQQFLVLAMGAGMDSAIMDPISPALRTSLYATEALLDQDPNLSRYLKAYRKKIIQ